MRAVLAVATLAVLGCGGTVVFEEDGQGSGSGPGGNGGNGGNGVASVSGVGTSTTTATVTSTGPSSVATSVSTGAGPCTLHEECAPGALCLFSSGLCATSCVADACDACVAGEVCDACATSSCPACKDCVAACIPTREGRCDDDDRCPNGGVCLHPYGYCAPPCDDPACADPNMYCEPCATGSSCGDDDCVAACFPIGR